MQIINKVPCACTKVSDVRNLRGIEPFYRNSLWGSCTRDINRYYLTPAWTNLRSCPPRCASSSRSTTDGWEADWPPLYWRQITEGCWEWRGPFYLRRCPIRGFINWVVCWPLNLQFAQKLGHMVVEARDKNRNYVLDWTEAAGGISHEGNRRDRSYIILRQYQKPAEMIMRIKAAGLWDKSLEGTRLILILTLCDSNSDASILNRRCGDNSGFNQWESSFKNHNILIYLRFFITAWQLDSH